MSEFKSSLFGMVAGAAIGAVLGVSVDRSLLRHNVDVESGPLLLGSAYEIAETYKGHPMGIINNEGDITMLICEANENNVFVPPCVVVEGVLEEGMHFVVNSIDLSTVPDGHELRSHYNGATLIGVTYGMWSSDKVLKSSWDTLRKWDPDRE